MKTSFLVTLLLVAAVCTHAKVQVKDSNGNPIKLQRAKYFIQPVKSNGGGLVPAATNILPFCPLGITQTILPYQPGLPVSFAYDPPLLGTDYIYTSTSLNIKFESDIWPVCNELSKLWAVDVSSYPKDLPVIIGGEERSPNSAFKIEEATEANTYKLTTSYGTVGTIPGAWLSAPQLIVTKDETKTLLVKFVKVDDDATKATTSTSRVEKLGLRMFPFY